MRKINSDVLGGLCFLLFALLFFFLSFDLSYTSSAGPGPMFFPVWLSGILSVLSLAYIIQSFRLREKPAEAGDRPSKMVMFVSFSMVLFVFLLSYVGFVVSTTIFLFLLLYNSYKWYQSLGISLVAAISFFLIFHSAFAIQLPVNVFGF